MAWGTKSNTWSRRKWSKGTWKWQNSTRRLPTIIKFRSLSRFRSIQEVKLNSRVSNSSNQKNRRARQRSPSCNTSTPRRSQHQWWRRTNLQSRRSRRCSIEKTKRLWSSRSVPLHRKGSNSTLSQGRSNLTRTSKNFKSRNSFKIKLTSSFPINLTVKSTMNQASLKKAFIRTKLSWAFLAGYYELCEYKA